MAAYEMGDMPNNPGNPEDEMAMEGSDFESPEAEVSPVEDLKAQIVGLDRDSLKELEATIADELSKQEEDEGEEAPEAPEEEAEEPSEDSEAGDLSAMFG